MFFWFLAAIEFYLEYRKSFWFFLFVFLSHYSFESKVTCGEGSE